MLGTLVPRSTRKSFVYLSVRRGKLEMSCFGVTQWMAGSVQFRRSPATIKSAVVADDLISLHDDLKSPELMTLVDQKGTLGTLSDPGTMCTLRRRRKFVTFADSSRDDDGGGHDTERHRRSRRQYVVWTPALTNPKTRASERVGRSCKPLCRTSRISICRCVPQMVTGRIHLFVIIASQALSSRSN